MTILGRLCLGLLFVAVAASPAGAAEKKTIASHDAAAEELLEIMEMDTTLQQSIDVALKAQLDQQPELLPFQDIMSAYLAKYLSYEAVKQDLIRIYAEAFTEKELKELIAFYRTETGKKSVTMIPGLMQKGAAIGAERVAQHQDELKAAVEARLKGLQATQQAPGQEAPGAPTPQPKEGD